MLLIKPPLIMGIINVTPDSFSGDGVSGQEDFVSAAVNRALRMIEGGADILDIGGESSRPGSVPITAEEEIRRVIPVIEAILQKTNIPLAIDTVKSSVAEASLKSGVTYINDVSALAHDFRMAEIIVRYKARVVLMHNKSNPAAVMLNAKLGAQYVSPTLNDIIEEVRRDLSERIVFAKKAGVLDHQIVLDVGIGFGKTVEQNLALINQLDRIKALGYPVLVGPSRKSFIGQVLDLPVEERIEGTAATVAACTLRGADILRVHDVKFMARVAKMAFFIGKNTSPFLS